MILIISDKKILGILSRTNEQEIQTRTQRNCPDISTKEIYKKTLYILTFTTRKKLCTKDTKANMTILSMMIAVLLLN